MNEAESTHKSRTAGVRWSEGGRFGVLPLWVLEQPISDRAKVLYARLAALAGAENATIRSQSEMERWMGCKRTAIRAALTELEEVGAITIEETITESGGRGRNSYVVHAMPPARAGEEAPPRDGDQLPIGDPEDLEPETASQGSGVASAAVVEVEDLPPRPARIGGRDLPFDALREVCHIHPHSPRLREIPSALNGGGKGRAPGIRRLAWQEIPLDEKPLPAVWEHELAERIRERAEDYARAMPGATLTPQALAKWWLDVKGGTLRPGAEDASRGRRAAQIAQAVLDQGGEG